MTLLALTELALWQGCPSGKANNTGKAGRVFLFKFSKLKFSKLVFVPINTYNGCESPSMEESKAMEETKA